MLLRRYMQHLRDQNWTAVWLDLVVVVAGIFLGLQVTEWSHGRADRQQKRIHLERLEHALDTYVGQVEQAIALQSALLDNHARIIGLLKKAVGPKRRINLFVTISQRSPSGER